MSATALAHSQHGPTMPIAIAVGRGIIKNVRHAQFGQGRIMRADDKVARIDFAGNVKDISLEIAKLEGVDDDLAPVPAKPPAAVSDSSPSIASGEAIPSPGSTAQPDTTPTQSDDEIIQWMASLNPLEYDRVRKEQATALRVQLKTLDAMVKGARSDESEADRLPFAEVEPHPEPIDPAILLSDVVNIIRQFIILDTEQAHASALWVALTWFIDDVPVAPLLVITAPEMACGKSQLRDLLSKIVQRSLSTNNLDSLKKSVVELRFG